MTIVEAGCRSAGPRVRLPSFQEVSAPGLVVSPRVRLADAWTGATRISSAEAMLQTRNEHIEQRITTSKLATRAPSETIDGFAEVDGGFRASLMLARGGDPPLHERQLLKGKRWLLSVDSKVRFGSTSASRRPEGGTTTCGRRLVAIASWICRALRRAAQRVLPTTRPAAVSRSLRPAATRAGTR